MKTDLNSALADIHLVDQSLRKLFSANPRRFEEFSLAVGDLLLDYSKQCVDAVTLQKLCEIAKSKNLSEHIQSLFAGGIVNPTEKRAALHTLLRDATEDAFVFKNKNIKVDIQSVMARIENFVQEIEKGKQFKTIISLGIGGSDLGPAMVTEALKTYKKSEIECYFVSNVDADTLSNTLKKCDPKTTLCIINSKTFTTPETVLNAKTIKAWMLNSLTDPTLVAQRLLAVTANIEKAKQFGILDENIFEFWDFVGGRYSVWSAVGLPIALTLGFDQFKAFLKGAQDMDLHFKTAAFKDNMPVLMALLSIWNSNKLGYRSHAIIPYDDGLKKFPDYLQQLMMESNGKRVNIAGDTLHYLTAPIIWGGVGCNGQHAYMQLLHQGTDVIPVDFLIAATPHVHSLNSAADLDLWAQHKLLVASCLSQSKALMEGTDMDIPSAELNHNENAKNSTDPLARHKICPGNRPSNTLMYPSLTPEMLGSLLALYEHIVFVQSILWDINAFDQYGVELGKQVVKQILPCLEKAAVSDLKEEELDSSTVGLIKYFHQF